MSILFKLTAVGIMSAILIPSVLLSTQAHKESQTTPVAKHSMPVESVVTNFDIAEEAEPTVIKMASLSIGSGIAELEQFKENKPSRTDTDVRLEQTRELVAQQKLEDALRILNGVRPSDRDHYDVKFLKARILSWSSQHTAAEETFLALRSQYPENADVMVSYGYLQFYQNKLGKAETIFVEVLAKHPDYEDAINGLARVRKHKVQ